MPVSYLSDAERLRFNSFPVNVSGSDVITYFTLSDLDQNEIPKTTSAANRLGFALRMLLLRFLGFHLEDLTKTPKMVVDYVAQQVDADYDDLAVYAKRGATRTVHLRHIEKHLGFRLATDQDLNELSQWLCERAMEHDRPLLLLQLLCEKFLSAKLVRPGFSIVERMVATARSNAEEEIYRLLEEIISEVPEGIFENILQSEQPNHPSLIATLRQSETANSPSTILSGLRKLNILQQLRVDQWDLSIINPNRRKQLAQIGFRYTAQALARMNKQRKYPILIAFLFELYSEILDELVEIYDRLLISISDRANRKLTEMKQEIASLVNDKIRILQQLVKVLIDPHISDEEIRTVVYEYIPEEQLQITYEECSRINEPLDEDFFRLIGRRYSYLRKFVPFFLDSIPLSGNVQSAGIIKAVEILRDLNNSGKRNIPADAPVDFVKAEWWDYVVENNVINRKYYELCVLYELRSMLRSADIWVEGSRRYAKLGNYLIPESKWTEKRQEVCDLLSLSENGEIKLKLRQAELQELYGQLDQLLDDTIIRHRKKVRDKKQITHFNPLDHLDKEINIRMENGKLIVTKLPGEEIELGSEWLKEMINERLPEIELTDLLIEVDNWTNFSKHFKNPSGTKPRTSDPLKYYYAGLLAQSCNFGLSQMQRMSGLSYTNLQLYSNLYLRTENLNAAYSELVNFHYQLPLAKMWGGGTLSSSDGQRFPVSVKTRNAVSIPKYFGYSRGLTFYTYTSDQYSQFGTKVIPSTVRDATYVLDEILDNETELTILEHTTDTAGYTHLVFGLFDLLGMQFSPRLADISSKTFYSIDKSKKYKNIKSLIKDKINTDLILRHWDELLWIAGSLKQGYVTASLLISKLMSTLEKNSLTKALEEWGKLNETIFMLKYILDPKYQKKITVQLNKGEALHALRRNIFVANQGKIRKRIHEDQLNQAACLNLVVNAVVIWNTVYIQAVLNQLKAEGYEIDENDIRNLSPARSEHINMYGRYYFNVEEGLSRAKLRDLKKPTNKY